MSVGATEPAERCVLAIDMGSGAAKGAVVTAAGRVLGTGKREIGTIHLPGGGAEQDPESWWVAARNAGRDALAHAGIGAERVLAVRCTTQWAVTVPVDESGRALTRAISWMDTRGAPHVARLVDGPLKLGGYSLRRLPRWLRLTGGAPVLAGMDGLGHVLHIKHDRPEVYAATRAFLEPMDYLNLRLTGRIAASYGSMYPYWLTDNRDVDRVSYDPLLLRWAGLDESKLPELLPMNAVVGKLTAEAAEALGLPEQTKVLTGLSDLQAAAVGAGIVNEGHAYFSIGTTSWLSCLVGSKKTDLRHLIATMPGALPGHHMVVAEQGPAGRCLDYLRDTVLYDAGDPDAAPPANVYERFEAAAASVAPGSDGLIFTPWLTGVAAPSADLFTRSAFLNQSLATTRAHYVRAVMEGVAFNLRWLKGHVERFAGQPFPSLRFIGGAALSATWTQILADVLGCEVVRAEEPRFATAAGAALAGFAALGEIRPEQIPAAMRGAATHTPEPAATRVYERQFEQFLRFHARSKRIYRSLNRERV